MHKNIIKNCFNNKGPTLAENIRYLMYKYNYIIKYVIKKVYTYYNEHTNLGYEPVDLTVQKNDRG